MNLIRLPCIPADTIEKNIIGHQHQDIIINLESIASIRKINSWDTDMYRTTYYRIALNNGEIYYCHIDKIKEIRKQFTENSSIDFKSISALFLI